MNINNYQVAEMYHQILLRISTDLMPTVYNHDGNIDYYNNVILYDEFLLYNFDNRYIGKSYLKRYKGLNKIAKLRDIVVYFDEEIQMFIMLPRVSAITMRHIKRDNGNIEMKSLDKIATDFCDQLVNAYTKIQERYTRDIARCKVINTNKNSLMNLLIARQLTEFDYIKESIYNLYYIISSEGDRPITFRNWRSHMFLFNRSLRTIYSTIKSEGQLPSTSGIVDPIIKLDIGKSDDLITVSKYKGIRFMTIDWKQLIDKSDKKILTNQFNINDKLIKFLPYSIIQMIETVDEMMEDNNEIENLAIDIVHKLSSIRYRIESDIVFRVSQFEYDDLPNQYACQKYISMSDKW